MHIRYFLATGVHAVGATEHTLPSNFSLLYKIIDLDKSTFNVRLLDFSTMICSLTPMLLFHVPVI